MQNVEPESPFQASEMQMSPNVFDADLVNTAGYNLAITSFEREK